jgi:glycosyltransferase involved in cell wall biosynthesis
MAAETVSVIMLAYNRETLLPRAADSILEQTWEDFELIMVNNGSSDKSGAIADGYAAKDNRVRVIHRERGNIGSGRNTGLDAAKGGYIAFIDDDDWCEPDYLEFLVKLAAENDAEISVCGAADKSFDEKRVMTAEEALIGLMRRKRYNMAFPAKMFRRELFDGLRFPGSGSYDDIALMYKIMAEAKRVAYHGLPKYTFYRHEGNHSAWTTDHSLLTPETLDEYLSVYRGRTVWLSERFPGSAEVWRYFEWSFMLSMAEKITRMGIAGCERQLAAMTEELRENREAFLSSGFIAGFEREWMDLLIRGGDDERFQ